MGPQDFVENAARHAGLGFGQHPRIGADKVGAEHDLEPVHLELAQHVGEQAAGVAAGLRLQGRAAHQQCEEEATTPDEAESDREES